MCIRDSYLVAAVATLEFPNAVAKFHERAPISTNLRGPSGDILDIVAYPEVSPSGSYLQSSFIDLTHSATRLRANNTSRGILGGYLDCFIFVAKEGKTQLKVSHLFDRTDMMSERLAKIMFSKQVETRMLVIGNATNNSKFLDSAKSVQFVRRYIMAMSSPGIRYHELLENCQNRIPHL